MNICIGGKTKRQELLGKIAVKTANGQVNVKVPVKYQLEEGTEVALCASIHDNYLRVQIAPIGSGKLTMNFNHELDVHGNHVIEGVYRIGKLEITTVIDPAFVTITGQRIVSLSELTKRTFSQEKYVAMISANVFGMDFEFKAQADIDTMSDKGEMEVWTQMFVEELSQIEPKIFRQMRSALVKWAATHVTDEKLDLFLQEQKKLAEKAERIAQKNAAAATTPVTPTPTEAVEPASPTAPVTPVESAASAAPEQTTIEESVNEVLEDPNDEIPGQPQTIEQILAGGE